MPAGPRAPDRGRVWCDEHLLRDEAMNPADLESLFEEWTSLGLQPTAEVDGQRIWQDCCVVQSMLGGPTRPRDWLELAKDGRSAWLKGTQPGEIVGPG